MIISSLGLGQERLKRCVVSSKLTPRAVGCPWADEGAPGGRNRNMQRPQCLRELVGNRTECAPGVGGAEERAAVAATSQASTGGLARALGEPGLYSRAGFLGPGMADIKDRMGLCRGWGGVEGRPVLPGGCSAASLAHTHKRPAGACQS